MQCGKLKLISDGGDSSSKECKSGYSGMHGGVWQSLESDGQFMLVKFRI
jgi:hypothetical protein